jgi:transposase
MTMTDTMKDAAGPGRGGRMSRQRKRDAVLRLRGEDLETVSRSLGVTAAMLSAWRDAFLAACEASLATRPVTGEAMETERLKARLGEMLLERELLEAKIAMLESGRPFDLRLNFHPVAIRASAFDTPYGVRGASGQRAELSGFAA